MKTTATLAILLPLVSLVSAEQCVLWNTGTRKVNYNAAGGCTAAACFSAGGRQFQTKVGTCCNLTKAVD
ncbi:hypothetical protein M3J09_002636 [Ascochyta lentis]